MAQRLISPSVYDLNTHTRKPEVERIVHAMRVIAEGIHFSPRPSFWGLSIQCVHAFGEAPRLAWRMIWDVEQRVARRARHGPIFTHVRAMHEAHVEPQRALRLWSSFRLYEAFQKRGTPALLKLVERLT